MASIFDTVSSAFSAASVISGYLPGLNPSSDPSAPIIERPDVRYERAALTTTIQVALLAFQPVGTKIKFDKENGCIAFDAPGLTQGVERTKRYYQAVYNGDKPRTSKNSLSDLKKDFNKLNVLYCCEEIDDKQLEAIQKICFYALKGLQALNKTYPGSLVKEFTDSSTRIFNEILKFKKSESSEESKPLERKRMEATQLTLYKSHEIEMVANTFESIKENEKALPLIQALVEQKISAWRIAVDAFLEDSFK